MSKLEKRTYQDFEFEFEPYTEDEQEEYRRQRENDPKFTTEVLFYDERENELVFRVYSSATYLSAGDYLKDDSLFAENFDDALDKLIELETQANKRGTWSALEYYKYKTRT